MYSTTPQERLRTLSLTSLLVNVILAIALVIITFRFHGIEETARTCRTAAAAGYWQHNAVQLENVNRAASDYAGQKVAFELNRIAAPSVDAAFDWCDTEFTQSGIG